MPSAADRGRASTFPGGVRGRAYARALIVAAAVILLDRLTKAAVVSGIPVGDVHKFLPGVQLVHVRNSGVAFGFFAGGGALVLGLTLVAMGALLVYFTLRPRRPLLWLPTGLVGGGAIGNLIDRVLSGSVTDFVKLPLWPAFNLADASITVGVLVLLYVLEGPSRGSAGSAGSSEGSAGAGQGSAGSPGSSQGSARAGQGSAGSSQGSDEGRPAPRVAQPER